MTHASQPSHVISLDTHKKRQVAVLQISDYCRTVLHEGVSPHCFLPGTSGAVFACCAPPPAPTPPPPPHSRNFPPTSSSLSLFQILFCFFNPFPSSLSSFLPCSFLPLLAIPPTPPPAPCICLPLLPRPAPSLPTDLQAVPALVFLYLPSSSCPTLPTSQPPLVCRPKWEVRNVLFVACMQGLNVLHDGGIHDGHVFVKLLTNRAACHLSLARPLRALQDCTMAVQVRAACFAAFTRSLGPSHPPSLPPTHPPTHSLTHLLTHSLTHSRARSLAHSLTCALTHTHMHALVCSHEQTHSLALSFTPLFAVALVPLCPNAPIQSVTHLCAHWLVSAFIDVFTHAFTHSFFFLSLLSSSTRQPSPLSAFPRAYSCSLFVSAKIGGFSHLY